MTNVSNMKKKKTKSSSASKRAAQTQNKKRKINYLSVTAIHKRLLFQEWEERRPKHYSNFRSTTRRRYRHWYTLKKSVQKFVSVCAVCVFSISGLEIRNNYASLKLRGPIFDTPQHNMRFSSEANFLSDTCYYNFPNQDGWSNKM